MTDARVERVSLAAGIRGVLEGESRKSFPEEACGLLVGRADGRVFQVERAVPCSNEAEPERRRNRFAIDPRRVIEEERALRGSGCEIVGFYHSHPTGEPDPSSVDRGFMELWPDVVWVIVGEERRGGGEGDAGGGERAIRGWAWDDGSPERPRRIPLEFEEAGGETNQRRGERRTT